MEFLECMKDLIRLDKDWVPKAKDCSLYLRPTFIGTQVRDEVGEELWGGAKRLNKRGICNGISGREEFVIVYRMYYTECALNRIIGTVKKVRGFKTNTMQESQQSSNDILYLVGSPSAILFPPAMTMSVMWCVHVCVHGYVCVCVC